MYSHRIRHSANPLRLYQNAGQAFYACAEGRLLQLSLWPYHSDRRTVSREQCNAMNTLAETIAVTLTAS